MTMALKSDVCAAQRRAGQLKPVDLVHLGAQTMGDAALEAEVLGIFAQRSRHYLAEMRAGADEATVYRAAHSLKGAARAIGAFELADRAARAETGALGAIDAVAESLDRVIAYIGTLK